MSSFKTLNTLESDNPLQLPEEDCLNRSKFCEKLAKTIGNREGKESLAIGITGDWGTGKTTIKNFIKCYLKRQNSKSVVCRIQSMGMERTGKVA